MTIRAQVFAGLRWTAGARFLAQVITWAITLVVIRILAPADYGLLGMATVFIVFLSAFAEFGLGAAIVQRAEIDVGTLRRALGAIIIVHFSLAALLTLSAPLIAAFFTEGRLVPIVRVLSLQFVVAAFAVIPDAMLQRSMRFRGRSLLDLSAAIAGGITTLALALAGKGVWALVTGAIVAQIWKTIGINAVAPFLHWPDFSTKGMRSLVRFGGHLAATQVLWIFFSQVDMVIGGKWLGKEALGFYTVAMHLASLPNQRISGIINQVAFPAFARMQHDGRSVGANLLLGTRLLAFFAFPVLWGISSIAPDIVGLILGSKWAPAIVPLQVLALVMPLRMIAYFSTNAVQGIGRSDILLTNTIWASLIAPVAFVIGVNWWGLLGLSVAWLVASPLMFLQGMMRSLPALGLSLGQFVAAMMPAAYCGIVMYSAVFTARYVVPAGQSGILRLCVLVSVGALAYFAASFMINRRGTREVLEIMRSIAVTKHQQSGVA